MTTGLLTTWSVFIRVAVAAIRTGFRNSYWTCTSRWVPLIYNPNMTPMARKLGQGLLDHHKIHCRSINIPPEDISDSQVRQSCITYMELSLRIGGPMPRFSAIYLNEIARWCQKNQWPSLASIVVNEKTGVPGPGYSKLHAGGVPEWQKHVRRCIAFRGYPDTMPLIM